MKHVMELPSVQENTAAVKNIKIKNTTFNFKEMMEIIEEGNRQTNNHYKSSGLKID